MLKTLNIFKLMALIVTAITVVSVHAKPTAQSIAIFNTLTSAGCSRIAYEPKPVYESVQGLKIGQLVLDHPEWAQTDQSKCISRPNIYFLPEGRAHTFIAMEEGQAFQKIGLQVYKQIVSGSKVWLSLKTRDSDKYVWVIQELDNMDVLSYHEDLAQGLGVLSETCDAQYCTPVPRSVQTIFAKAGMASLDCVNSAYDIEGIAIHRPSGRKVYQVRLKQELVPEYGTRLPLKAQVPILDNRNNWTGVYYPGGCPDQ